MRRSGGPAPRNPTRRILSYSRLDRTPVSLVRFNLACGHHIVLGPRTAERYLHARTMQCADCAGRGWH